MENEKALHTYTLVFEGPNDQSLRTLQVLKGVFIADFSFSAAEVMQFLNNAPVVVKRSENLEELKPMFHRLVEAGARVLILESTKDELSPAARQEEALQNVETAVKNDAWKVFGDDDHQGSKHVSAEDVMAIPFEISGSPTVPSTSNLEAKPPTSSGLENTPRDAVQMMETAPETSQGAASSSMTLSGILAEADPMAPDPIDLTRAADMVVEESVVPLSGSGLLIDDLPPPPDLNPRNTEKEATPTSLTPTPVAKAPSLSGLSLDSTTESPARSEASSAIPRGTPVPASSLGGLTLNDEPSAAAPSEISEATIQLPKPAPDLIRTALQAIQSSAGGSGSGLSLNASSSGLSLGNSSSNSGLSLGGSGSGLNLGGAKTAPASPPAAPTKASNSGLSLNASNSGLSLGGGSNSGLSLNASESGLKVGTPAPSPSAATAPVPAASSSSSGLKLGGSNSGLSVGGSSSGLSLGTEASTPPRPTTPQNPESSAQNITDGLAISFESPAPTVKSAALETNATAALEAESSVAQQVAEGANTDPKEADEDLPLSEKFKQKKLEQAAEESNQRRGTDDELTPGGLLVGNSDGDVDVPLTRWEKLQEKIPVPIDILVPVIVGTLALMGFHVWQYRQQSAEQERRATPKVTRSAAPAQAAKKNPANPAEVQKKSNVLIDYIKKPQDAAKGVASKLEARDAAIGSQIGGISPTE